MNTISIDGRTISKNSEPYIVAEISANHNGSIERAFESFRVAKECGADAVKIQTYTADTITIKSNREEFRISGGLWDGYDLYTLYKEAETPYEWHKDLFEYAKSIGITIFSSPFDHTAVDLLEGLNTPAYKIASPEIVDLPLIKRVAQTRKPMIISTGMANFKEICSAVEIAKSNNCQDLVLLHCVSGYPTPINEINLSTINDLEKDFSLLTGLSDHTMGTTAAVASTALGACMIEKHFTLSRRDKGPDSEFSLEPNEFEALCKDVRMAWKAMGVSGYEPRKSEINGRKYRRSLYVVQDIRKGELFSSSNIKSIRPALGLQPKYYDQILGKVSTQDIECGTPLTWDHVVSTDSHID